MNNSVRNKALSKDIPPAERESYWREQVALKASSGLTAAAYCRLHELNWDQYGYWERKLRKEVAPSSLIPVNLKVANAPISSENSVICSVTLKSGAELKLYDVQALPNLVSVLN